MSEYKLSIKTTADLRALEATKSGLTEASKATKAMGKDTAALETEIKKVDAALSSEAANAVRAAEGLKKAIAATKEAKGNTGPLVSQLTSLQSQHGLPVGGALMNAASRLPVVGNIVSAGAAGGGAGVAVAAGAAAMALATKAAKEYAEAEDRVASLDAALAQSGQLTDAYRERLQALAGEFQKVTGVADDQWLGVLARLTQFGSKPETIGMDMEAVKNLAGIMKGDVIGAAEAYSRALQGNFEMFGRLGIKVDEAGTQMEKLAKLQEQLAERGGGQLEARNKTLLGQWQQLKNSTADLFESFGRIAAATGIWQKALGGLSTAFSWWADKLGGTIPQVEGLRNASQEAADAADSAASATNSQADAAGRLAENSKRAADALAEQRKQSEELKRHQDKIDDLDMAGELEDLKGKNLPEAAEIAAEKEIRQRYKKKKNTREMESLVGDRDRMQATLADTTTSHGNLQQAITDQANKVAQIENQEAGRTSLEDKRKAALAEAKRLESEAAKLDDFIANPPALTTGGDLKTARAKRDDLRSLSKGEQARAEMTRQEIERFNTANPQIANLPDERKRLKQLEDTGAVRFPEWEGKMETLPKEIQQKQLEIEREDEIQQKEWMLENKRTANATQKAQTSYIEQGATTAGPVSDREAQTHMKMADNNVKAADALKQLKDASVSTQQKILDEIRNLHAVNNEFVRQLDQMKQAHNWLDKGQEI